MSIQIQKPPNESWDCMLPGPPSRNNGGSADISPAGLFAYASGSSVSVVETHSMQLVTTIPLPPPSSSTTSLSPFITSVKWSPQNLPHLIDVPQHHLLLAVGDRQGRICLLDFRSKSPTIFFDTGSGSKLGIQDLCWVQTGPDSWILAALCGPSLLSLFNTSTGRCFFKYDAAPEYFSCLRRDPFDSRHFCALGLKGFLLSVTAMGDTENDVVLKELQIRTDTTELQKLERDSSTGGNGAPASATFPTYISKFAFSPHWMHLIFVAFPRELVVFDLQYETALFSSGLPRGCGKFLEVLPDSNIEVLYCAHLDGKLSTWRRKERRASAHNVCDGRIDALNRDNHSFPLNSCSCYLPFRCRLSNYWQALFRCTSFS
uniref:WDR11 first beta-propeller domain-containing protein n=1 Tax=Solanum lycopersicum TaxID=4081 RepID=A0A3Q7H442_SOLLC